MRVAVFTDNDFDKVNGVTTTLTALIDRAPADVSARIYTAAALGTDAPNYFALPSLAIPIPFYWEMEMHLPRCREYLRRVMVDEVDLLHVTTPGPMGLTGLWVAAKTGLPLVGSFHTDLTAYTAVLSGSKHLGSLMARYQRWFYARCVRTLVPSLATRELLVASGVAPHRVGLWTRGVDSAHFTPVRRSPRLRAHWRVASGDVVLLYVGRVSREKGLEMLPEMLYRLRAYGVGHRMVIAGDGPLRKTLMEQMPDAVFMGTLTRSDVADVFASADLLVFPSTTDTAGNVVLEAQASGLPVIVSGRGGPREHMRPGVTGVVCDHDSPKRWAEEIACLVRDAARRRAMATAAREFAASRSWDVALGPVYDVYRSASRAADSVRVHHAA